ncbi:MAG: glycosyltransferase family 4 protein [Terriglobales bacterium]
MNLLYLFLEPPLPPANGLRMRTRAVLRAIAAAGHDVRLVGFGSLEQAAALRAEGWTAEVVPAAVGSLSQPGQLASRWRALLAGSAYAIGRFENPELRRKISASLDGGRCDAVLVDTIYPAANLPLHLGVPLLVNSHNVEHLLLRRYAESEWRPHRRGYAGIEWRRLRSFERQLFRHAQHIWACSRFDRDYIKRLAPDTACTVLPNTVPVIPNLPAEPANAHTVLFTGGLDWLPNRQAVLWFLARVWPRLRAQAPEARWVVAGRNPPADLCRRLAEAGVEVRASVLDMRAVFAEASVCIAPLRIASGTRLKILEAGAMGKPVVATRRGAEGLNLSPGREIVIADDPAEMATAIARLLRDAATRRAIGAAARSRIREEYAPQVLASILRHDLASVIRPAVACSRAARPLVAERSQ